MKLTSRQPDENWDHYYWRLKIRSEREDLLMFTNACFAATSQAEFYDNHKQQTVSIQFLHSYVLANYRGVYARTLSAGINEASQSRIVLNLLAAGSPSDASQRAEEGELIAKAIESWPPTRAFRLFRAIRKQGINNRRTRAVIARYLANSKSVHFHAVKYRRSYRIAINHCHAKIESDTANFLFRFSHTKRFENELYDRYRQAHFSAAAIYDLPFTIAESLAAKHRVPRDVFLKKIQPKMTNFEKLRLQNAASENNVEFSGFDIATAPLTRLAVYILSLSPSERQTRFHELNLALETSARRTSLKTRLSLERTAVILDRSYSSIGSREKRQRPLAVALALAYLLRAASNDARIVWTPALNGLDELSCTPFGQTALAEPLIDLLSFQPKLVLIVSDGFENDPPHAVNQVVTAYRSRINTTGDTEFYHLNPVFDVNHFAPRALGDAIITVGLRDAEDLATVLSFARLASNQANVGQIEDYLATCSRNTLESR